MPIINHLSSVQTVRNLSPFTAKWINFVETRSLSFTFICDLQKSTMKYCLSAYSCVYMYLVLFLCIAYS